MNAVPEITEAQFFEMVDRYIAQANEFSKQFPQPQIIASMLFAAARFNAHHWLNRTTEHAQTVDQAAPLFAQEYEKMFRNNVDQLEASRAKN
jgi:hypothetical protein